MNIMKFTKKCLKWDNPTCVFTMVLMVLIGVYLYKSNVFREGFGKKKLSTILYCYWKDCGYCKQFNPTWSKFESYSKNNEINVVKVEKDDDYNDNMQMSGADVMKKYDVQGYPSIMLLDTDNNKITDYKGPRSLTGLKELLN
jgi:hypothetical protein